VAGGIGAGAFFLSSDDDPSPTTVPVATTRAQAVVATTAAPVTTEEAVTTAAPTTTSAPTTTTVSPQVLAARDAQEMTFLWERLDEALRLEGPEIAAAVIWESNAPFQWGPDGAFAASSPDDCVPIVDPAVGGITRVAPVADSITAAPGWEPPPEFALDLRGTTYRFYELTVQMSYAGSDDSVSATAHMVAIDTPPRGFRVAWFWPCEGYLPVDTELIVAAWDALNGAWEQGYEAAARYVTDHAHPGVPADYEDCLQVYGEATVTPRFEVDPGTIERDDAWEPGFGIELEGRNYVMDAEVLFDGEPVSEIRVRTAVIDGQAFLFQDCIPEATQ
jgi:hypothetical protein